MKNNQIHQEVSGDGNLVAGGNIGLNEFTPDPNNPNIMECYCGWSGLSKWADICPKCGHNHLADRIRIDQEQKQKNGEYLLKVIFLLFVTFISTALLQSYFSIPIGASFLITIFGLALIFWCYIEIKVRFEIWINKK